MKYVLRVSFAGYLLDSLQFTCLLGIAFKSSNGKLEYTITPYIENAQTVPSIEV